MGIVRGVRAECYESVGVGGSWDEALGRVTVKS